MNYTLWSTKKVNPLELHLDTLNPRVFLNSDATQEEIRNFLIRYYDVLDLAKEIRDNRGLSPAENIIVTIEDEKLIVIEGNRRVAACQILLKPFLLDETYRNKIEIPSGVDEYIGNIEVKIAPSRDDAEPIITLRHTETGIRRWSRLSNVRRVMLRYKEGVPITKIAKIFNISDYNVKRSIQFNSFMEYVINELNWTEDELNVLKNPLIETSIIDRFLPFSRIARVKLEIYFDDNHEIKTNLPKELFDKKIKEIVKKCFIDESINTRTPVKDVFDEDFLREIEEYKTKHKSPEDNQRDITKGNKTTLYSNKNKNESNFKQSVPKSNINDNKSANLTNINDSETTDSTDINDNESSNPTKKQKMPKRKYLYEGINYDGNRTGIQRALFELHRTNHNNFTLSATYLVRTLIECSLQAYLDEINEKYMDNGRDPSLTKLINYYVSNKILDKKNHQLHNILVRWKNEQFANKLNAIVHAKYLDIHPHALEEIERESYYLIQFLTNEIS